MKRRRIVYRILIWALAVVIVIPLLYAGFSLLQLKKTGPDAGAGFSWPYYVYISRAVRAKAEAGEKIYILVMPNNTMTTSEGTRRDDRMARISAVMGKTVYGDLDTIILVPVFPRPEEHCLIYTHALDRDTLTTDIEGLERPDLQLLAMIDDLRGKYAQEGWDIDSRVLMDGFSASGMFVNRFTLMHPDRVLAASVGSPGGWPIAPVGTWEGETLRYPIGINDLEALTGESVDMETYKKIPQVFYLGEQDYNDSVPYGDSYEDEARELINRLFGDTPVERWPVAEQIYGATGINARFIMYEGAGHRPILRAFREAKELFRGAMADQVLGIRFQRGYSVGYVFFNALLQVKDIGEYRGSHRLS